MLVCIQKEDWTLIVASKFSFYFDLYIRKFPPRPRQGQFIQFIQFTLNNRQQKKEKRRKKKENPKNTWWSNLIQVSSVHTYLSSTVHVLYLPYLSYHLTPFTSLPLLPKYHYSLTYYLTHIGRTLYWLITCHKLLISSWPSLLTFICPTSFWP